MKLVNYILHMVEGKDGQLSIRRFMAMMTFVGLIRYVEERETPDPMAMSVYVGLIAALLALTTWQNSKDNSVQP